jgi:succinyl-diaminopimelate desuccinylase
MIAIMEQELLALLDFLVAQRADCRENANHSIEQVADWLENKKIPYCIYCNDGILSLLTCPENSLPFVFNGHLDVVPANAEQYRPRIVADRYYARGAYDMLGAVAAMLLVMAKRQARGLAIPPFALSSCEETQGEAGIGYLMTQGHSPQFVVCGEPTNFQIGIQAKGILRLALTFQGIAAHGSRPWLGENAILKCMEKTLLLKELPFMKQSTEYFASPSLNVAWITGGDIYNRVPDNCRMGIEIRYLPGQDCDEIIRQVVPLATRVKEILRCNCTRTDAAHPLVEKLLKTVCQEKVFAEKVGQDGASDCRFYSAAGIPTVEFGPVGAGHHGPDEWVSIASLQTYARILNHFCENVKE